MQNPAGGTECRILNTAYENRDQVGFACASRNNQFFNRHYLYRIAAGKKRKKAKYPAAMVRFFNPRAQILPAATEPKAGKTVKRIL